MGYLINWLKKVVYSLAQENRFYLRIGGLGITIILILLSSFSGWIIEQTAIKQSLIPLSISQLILIIALSSSIAYKSLSQSVLKVVNCLDDNFSEKRLEKARKELSHIVGRDVNHLSESEILRAAAETASENSVDGIFAPLFWIFVGSLSWKISTSLPGPLAFAWAFKASSTMDSMIGYNKGKLKWLGSSSARLDDILTFLPCRLVVITLPLISKNWLDFTSIVKKAIEEGRNDLSPNSGLSEAIFAHCLDISMGGTNSYNNNQIHKPILAKSSPSPNSKSIKRLLKISFRLELAWTIFMVTFIAFI